MYSETNALGVKKQVILIRGGEVKENYKDFYDFLEKQEYDPYENKGGRWYKSLSTLLGNNFDTIVIPMPNKEYADYKAWKIVFEKHIKFFKENCIFIGHSLGGTFLTKYFDECNNNKIKNKIGKIILIAPASEDIEGDLIGSFEFNKEIKNFKIFQNKIIIFASKDDFVVPFSHFEYFKEKLPKIKYKIFEDRGHFLQENFDELIKEIKNK